MTLTPARLIPRLQEEAAASPRARSQNKEEQAEAGQVTIARERAFIQDKIHREVFRLGSRTSPLRPSTSTIMGATPPGRSGALRSMRPLAAGRARSKESTSWCGRKPAARYRHLEHQQTHGTRRGHGNFDNVASAQRRNDRAARPGASRASRADRSLASRPDILAASFEVISARARRQLDVFSERGRARVYQRLLQAARPDAGSLRPRSTSPSTST
jgi:hypothetical protein